MKKTLFFLIILFLCFLTANVYSIGENGGNNQKTEKSSSRNSHYAFIASGSDKYRLMEKNLIVVDIDEATANPGKSLISLVPVYATRISFSEDGKICLAGNGSKPFISLIDADKALIINENPVIATVNLSAPPSGITICPGRHLAFILENSIKLIEVIDIEKAKHKAHDPVIARIELGKPVINLSFSPDGNHLILIDNELRIIDIEMFLKGNKNTEISVPLQGFDPSYLIFDRSCEFLFISDFSKIILAAASFKSLLSNSGKIDLIKGRAKLTAIDQFFIKSEEGLDGNISFCPGENNIFMVHPCLNRMSILDASKIMKGEAKWGVNNVPTGRCPLQVRFTDDGKLCIVNNLYSGNIFLYNTEKCLSNPENAIISKVAIPSPVYLSIRPNGKNPEITDK